MLHDPLQTYAMLGAYSGGPNQLLSWMGQPNYGQYPTGLNPLAAQQQLQLASILAAQNPQLGLSLLQNPIHAGLGGLQNPFGGIQQNPFSGGQQNPFGGIQQNPFGGGQQNQYGGIQQNPFGGGQQNPFGGIQQNPLSVLQNPLIAALQNPLLAATLQNPAVLQQLTQQPPYQQGGFGTPFGQTGYPLAPQSWIGQTGIPGQIHPLYQHLAARAFSTPGLHPWAGF